MLRLFIFILITHIGLLSVSALIQAQPIAPSAAAEDSANNEPDEAEEKADDAESDTESDKSEDASKTPDSADSKDSDGDEEEAKSDGDKSEDEDKSKDESAKPKKTEKKRPKPYKVKVEKLTIEAELDGVFVADEMEELVLRPEVWSRFKVREAVEHGTEVKKGEVLIRFDDEDLEEDLSEEALDQSIGQLALLQEEEEYPRVKRLLELSLESAERRYQQVKDDYEYYHETDRPFTVQLANFRYKSAQEQLASAEEELKQLQQMYEADEITEETEEIVLRRQKFAVETAKVILKINKESRDYTLDVSLPRSDASYETRLEEAELSYKQAKTAVEMGTTRKSYEMEKKRQARAKSVERHGELLSDKALMELRAPCDGVVYYGKCTSGKWTQINSMKAKLKPFGTATPNTVLMTVVKPGALHIESSIGEKQVPDIKTGQLATVAPTADEELELAGKVAHVDAIPGASNKFKVEIEFEDSEAPEWLVAGMTCESKIVIYENEEAVIIPQDLVNTDEDDEKTKYVMLVDPDDDKPVRRKVKLGRKKDKVVEVLKGLEAGDQIVKEDKKDQNDD